MKHVFYLIFIAVFITSCSSVYKVEDVNNEFNIVEFRNSYTLRSDKTDSIFDVFKDDELKQLVILGLKQNSDIFIYDSRIKIAESQIKLATSKQMPNVNGNVSYSYNGDSIINTNLMASWELDIFGKYALDKKSYIENYNIAKKNLDFFKISLISDISLAYFNLKYLQSNIILTKERIKNYYEIVRIMDIMYKNGFIAFSDFLENKVFLQQEEQSLNTLQNDYEAKKNELRVLINDSKYEFNSNEYHFYTPKFHINLDSSAEVILNRPDIQAQISNLNSAIYRLNSSKADLYPSISLSASLGKAFLSPAEFAYQILSSLTLPLFSRFEIYENIKINEYTKLEAYYTLQKALNTALSEIENAIYSLESNKNTLQTSIDMLNQNEETLYLLKKSNELGLVDSVEYLQALNSNLLMLKNNNTSYFNTISATIYLYRSIGGNMNDLKDFI
ncbi:TolC family protein [Helicobacter sp. MIT 14-3879]|uniref:TolC family protein n=1 Tax=Helicobacter sp. MIT 14-3879 TaxID=2040649 RepID=UPI000E1ED463|nr:TolC family protein [Helicobacter sp. MIT 14-3879]RDU65543.1 hypothetical protein CQA44_00730 [Helicobacter sp. MIT 14-3879]